MASNHAAATLQAAQDSAASQLAMANQTNALSAQGTANTQRIADAIANQNTVITNEFCDLKDREYQSKIEQLTADNALLRSNINNANQTQTFAAMIAPLQAQLASISAKQPQTITLPMNQYAVVPSWYANAGTDFVASYWANRLSQATTGGTADATKASV